MEPKPTTYSGPNLVAFDFDGTLTVRDSYTRFFKWHAGLFQYYSGITSIAPALITYLFDRDRGRLKSAATRYFLGGLSHKRLESLAEDFAAAHFDALIRPDALASWQVWGNNGAERVIVTASPEIIVAPFAKRLGADRLIGTRLAFDDQERVTGDFIGPNCRAVEKVIRLRAVYGDDVQLKAAYGDTSGDTEMLALAKHQGWREFKARPVADS